MSFNKYIAVLPLIFLGMISLNSNCSSKLDCRGTVYSFDIGIKGYPDKDSILVGDTLWLEVNTPTKLTDVQTGRLIDYSGAANLSSAVGFQALNTSTARFTIEAAQKFNFLIIHGVEIANRTPTLYHEYLFSEVNGSYVFKVGMIPKEKGTFSIVFSNATRVYRNNDKCTKASFALNFKNTNQHYYLNPNFQGGPTPIGGDYYFKVN